MARISRKWHIEEKTAIISEKYKCAIYARISKETPELSNSIDNQIGICESFIEKNSDFEIYNTYVDRSFSGYTFDRPSFKKMMSDIVKGLVNAVIIKDFSRLGRNNLDVLILVKETFEEDNIRLISINNDYDSLQKNRSSELSFALSNITNERYIRQLSENIKASLHQKKKRAEPLGLAPLGYYLSEDKKKLLVNEKEAIIVRRIFDLFLEGISFYMIAKKLTAKKTPTYKILRALKHNSMLEKHKTLKPWSESSIRGIITNEVYIGKLRLNKVTCTLKQAETNDPREHIVFEHAHEAIIECSDFAKAQELVRKTRENSLQKNSISRGENIFLKKLICAHCGKFLKRSGKAENSFIYTCRHCRSELQERTELELLTPLRHRDIVTIISACIRNECKLAEKMTKQFEDKLAESRLSEETATFDYRLSQLYKNKKQTENIIINLYKDFSSSLLSEEEYLEINNRLVNQLQEIDIKINYINTEKAKYQKDTMEENKWYQLFADKQESMKFNREIVEKFVSKIVVDPFTKDLHIEFMYQDSFFLLVDMLNSGDKHA